MQLNLLIMGYLSIALDSFVVDRYKIVIEVLSIPVVSVHFVLQNLLYLLPNMTTFELLIRDASVAFLLRRGVPCKNDVDIHQTHPRQGNEIHPIKVGVSAFIFDYGNNGDNFT
jgi:hypothetical protein